MNLQDSIQKNKEIINQLQSQLKPLYYFYINEGDISDELYDNIRETSYDTKNQIETPYMEFDGVECHIADDYNNQGYEWLIFTVATKQDAKHIMKHLGVPEEEDSIKHYIKYSL